jgi:L,D-peptidoglycan transpeptidase YkuD (ErfK/YbiS/YcfS/YnhG family)
MILHVDSGARLLSVDGLAMPCAIGRSGACPAEVKREGDGMTPAGVWPVRAALFRPGRAAPPPGLVLPWRWVRDTDGWSDDPADPAYNRPVRHPHRHSAERLIRDDALYDIIVLLGHNDAPPVPGRGSAIFLHCWNDAKPTEGCVAIDKAALLGLVARMRPESVVAIV